MTQSTADFRTLIEPAELAALSAGARLAIIDCRHDLARPEWGGVAYASGHIPGATFAHLDRDLSGPITPHTGRHPLPDREQLAARLGAWGIDRGVQAVVYDQGNGAIAARLWWLLRWLGHESVALLNGGLAAWETAGLPVTAAAAAPPSRQFAIGPALGGRLTTAQLLDGLARSELTLVDARSAERFAGRNETIDPVAGHIPGARNHPFTANLDARGRFLEATALRSAWQRTLEGERTERVVAMCGSGVTACHNLLALERAGLRGARLYADSWSGWIRDPQRPIARD